MKNVKLGSLNPNLRVLLIPTLIILSVVVLGFFLWQEGYSRIKGQIAALEAAQKTQNILQTKYDTLNKFPKSTLFDEQKVLSALPDKSPVMALIALLRKTSAEQGIVLDRMSLTSVTSTEDLQTAEILLTAQLQDVPSLLNFIRTLYASTPLTTIQDVSVEQDSQGEGLAVDLNLAFYWAGLPTTIPSVSTPIQGLTEEENVLLAQIGKLSSPAFTILTPQGPKERLTPFN